MSIGFFVDHNGSDLEHPGELDVTFRDPAGQLRLTASHALRRISPAAVAKTQAFLASPLRAALESSGDLVATEIAGPGTHPFFTAGELWLQHPRIDPIGYPWEWTPAQWAAAAELTLRVAARAIEAGWILKDATPLNVVFAGPRPVLVDVLSLERRDLHSAIWLAYGQFVRTFLLPLAATKYLGWSLENALFHRDGYEPRDIFAALYPWQRFYPHLFDVVTLATLLEDSRGSKGSAPAAKHVADAGLAKHLLLRRIARLGRQIRRATPSTARSRWSDYPQSASHYSAADIEEKKAFVRRALERLRPGRVLDIGANTGTYSLLAADTGAQVVALDNDVSAIQLLWNSARRNHRPVTALVANIARPTPAAGWRNREHLSLLDRFAGNFDMVLMLAVIHHMILREQLPLAHIASLCSSLTRRALLLEWIPPSDPMYREWLRGRDDLYGSLSEEDLLDAFRSFFRVADRKALGNGRILLLLERMIAAGEAAGAVQA